MAISLWIVITAPNSQPLSSSALDYLDVPSSRSIRCRRENFFVTFPMKESLKMMASCSNFTLSLNQVMVSVKVAIYGAKAVASLSETWVLFNDVPSGLRNVHFLTPAPLAEAASLPCRPPAPGL